MNKKTVLYILLELVFLVLFNTVFFVIGGFEHPASVWISYGFIHFAYLMILITPLLIRKGASKSLFGITLYSVSSVYFFVEFVVGLIFIFIRGESFKASLVTQVIIAGIYAILLIVNMLANEYTADNEEKQEEEVEFIKKASSRVKLLMDKASDKAANKEIEKAYDMLHSSPIKSHATVKSLESQINNKITELEDAVDAGIIPDIVNFAGEIVALAEERNRKVKLAEQGKQ